MNRAYFAICLHFHQPIGNFDHIVERAYQNCYKPFLDIFERYPAIKMTFHFSGCLLDYIEAKHPEYLKRVKRLVDNHQVEMMGGGYYEPIFIAIPERDRIGQINLMSEYLKENFGKRPQGIWITERVWSSELIKDFNEAKVKYGILDDEHFLRAGLNADDLYGYFTAKNGSKEGIAIFPSNKRLRYSIPFKMPEEIINYFREAAGKFQQPLFTYGDDGEKFGEWPGTHNWVYNENWLSKFFNELDKNKDWLETVLFSEYLKHNKPKGDVHIPEASYQEMMEWANGSWLNFLKKYPETNQMHKKMCYISRKVYELETSNQRTETRKEKSLIKDAKNELYKGQCNCAYWHGVFGGIYLYHLRKAVYEHLIKAENIIGNVLHKNKKEWLEIKSVDFYGNNTADFVIENKDLFVSIDTAMGGMIRELDYKKASVNLINTFARHPEPYHKKILEQMNAHHDSSNVHTIHEGSKAIKGNLEKEFVYDKHARGCLIEHFMSPLSSLDDFIHCKFNESGDFVNSGYKGRIEDEKVVLERDGIAGGQSISLKKTISLNKNKELGISYVLKNNGGMKVDIVFGVEFNLTMPNLNSSQYSYFSGKQLGDLNSTGIIECKDAISLQDSSKEFNLNLSFSDTPKDIWYFPVKTVSQSERAYELNYQASCILPRWHICLDNGKEMNIAIKLKIK